MPTDRLARLRALIEQWKADANGPFSPTQTAHGAHVRLQDVVELEGVLAIPPQPPEEEEKNLARVAPLVDCADQSSTAEPSPGVVTAAERTDLLADLRKLEYLYNTDGIVQQSAREIERIFDKWLHRE